MKTIQLTTQSYMLLIQKNLLLIKENNFMKKLTLLSAFILLIFSSGTNDLFSQVNQEWARYWYLNGWGSQTKCSAVDNLGNTVVTGTSVSSGTDIVTLRYNSQGDLTWVKVYTNTNQYNSDDGVSDLVIDDQNNIYITGFTANSVSANRNIVTIKYSSSGDSLWVRHFAGAGNGNDEGKAITLDESGNVYVTGYSTTSGTDKDYLTIKYDNNGNEIWVRNSGYSPSIQNIAYDIAVDNQGNVFVTGNMNFFLTLKYNSDGDLKWGQVYSGNGGGTSYVEKKLVADKSGNVYVTGTVRNTITFDDFITIKYDSLGNQVWLKSYNGPSNSSDYAIALNLIYQSGNDMHPDLVVAGTSQNNFLTIKYDGDDGSELWKKIHSGVSQSSLRSLAIDNLGNVVVAGNRYNAGTGDDFLTVNYDGMTGNERWSMMYNLGGSVPDNVENVSIGPDGAVYVSGKSAAWTNHILIVKYKEPAVLNLTAFIDGMYDNTSNTMVPDTVIVYLRNASSPFTLADSSKLLLGNDGKGTFIFHNTTPGIPYYVAIKHRNSLETWSADPVIFSGTSVNYDFTTASNKAYGNNLIQKGNKYCIISGELDGDGYVDVSDMSIVENDFFNNLSGYINSDLNGDLILDATDLSIIANSASGGFGAMSPLIDAGLLMRGLQNGKTVVKKNISQEKSEPVTGLKDNYPNPFNPSTMISYDLKSSGKVSLKIYNAVGKEVAILVNEFKERGSYNVRFDASHLASGMYFYKLVVSGSNPLQTNGFSQTKKMLLVK
jgi:hypothetical protein